jgi:hypothetical protein
VDRNKQRRPGVIITEEYSMVEKVLFFTRYPFTVGQRLHIVDGPRRGDWEVTAVDEKKVSLRCPVSGVEVVWNRFCYLVEEKDTAWPAKE